MLSNTRSRTLLAALGLIAGAALLMALAPRPAAAGAPSACAAGECCCCPCDQCPCEQCECCECDASGACTR